MIDFQAVGNKIAAERKRMNLTQDELSARLNVTRQLVSKWELGNGVPTIDTILELTKIFGISFEELLCMNSSDDYDSTNIFAGHSRDYVLNNVLSGKWKVNIPEVIYQFSPKERMLILKSIKEKKINVSINELQPYLTTAEKRYLNIGGKI